MALAAVGVCALALGAGCVTRTVYVVDDRDEPALAAAPQAAPLPTAPPRGMDLAGPDEFYEPLAPYGSWHSHPRYGYVFAPSSAIVGAGWRPYTRGHWEYTEWGWTWVSDLPFGWATSHYGNWFYDAGHGWVWVPGTRWAPAWVTWRTGGGYVGWAPMPPGATYGAAYSVYDTAWIFVSTDNFGAPLIYPVIVTGGYYRNCLVVTRPYRTTYVVYGSTYYRGPDPDYVRREGGRVVHRPISEVDEDRPTTRPPRGVRVTSAGHNGHDGSVGSRRNGRSSDGAGSRGRDDDGRSARGRDDDGRSGRDRGDDRVSDRRDGAGSDRGNGRSDGRGDDRYGRDDDRVARPDDTRGGREYGDDGLPSRVDPRDGRGQGRDREQDPSRPGRGRDVPASAGTQAPGTIDDGLIVTPTPFPGGGSGGGRDDDDGSSRGGSDDDDDDDSNGGGVPADKNVVRPDRGEVRPPSDNPYASDPYGNGRGSSNGFGAQSAPSSSPGLRDAPGAVRPSDPGPADSRFGRRLPSRFGSPATATPSPSTRSPRVAPPSSPSNGYGRVAPQPSPTNGYGRVAPQPSPYRQQTRSQVAPSRTAPSTPQYAPAPRSAPTQRATQSRGSDDDDRRKQERKKRDTKERKQSRTRR